MRELLNISYADLTQGMSAFEREAQDRQLAEPFEHELTPEQRKRAEARRILEARGQTGAPEGVMRYMKT